MNNVTPDEIYHIDFKKAPIGRRGYDEDEVDDFLDRVRVTVSRLLKASTKLAASGEQSDRRLAAENAQLRAQLQHAATASQHNEETAALRQRLSETTRELEQLRVESEKDILGISTRSVNLLSQAQMSADTTIEQAETYARDLVMSAREQYRDILDRAHHSTGDTATSAVAVGNYTEPISQVEYVRTYTEIARTQLQSVVQALSAQIDQLAGLPDLPGTGSDHGITVGANRTSEYTPARSISPVSRHYVPEVTRNGVPTRTEYR